MVRTWFTVPLILLSLGYPPCVCNVGDIPFAEYTRRLCSNIRSYGGVCIMPTTRVCVVLFIFIYYMRRGVAQSVTRIGNAAPNHCRYGIGYLLARSFLYTAFVVTYQSDVILVSHILSIQ